MDFDRKLDQLADRYKDQGYRVIVGPTPQDLPSFATHFKVEIIGLRNGGGVLVSVKKNRQEMAADGDLANYASVTSAQPGWRYDLAVLESEDPFAWELRGAEEASEELIKEHVEAAKRLVSEGQFSAACLIAWAGFEAAMRRRMRQVAEPVGGGTVPRTLLNELYSGGILSAQDFRQLERSYELRNRLAHGFRSQADAATVQFLISATQRLLDESRSAVQTA